MNSHEYLPVLPELRPTEKNSNGATARSSVWENNKFYSSQAMDENMYSLPNDQCEERNGPSMIQSFQRNVPGGDEKRMEVIYGKDSSHKAPRCRTCAIVLSALWALLLTALMLYNTYILLKPLPESITGRESQESTPCNRPANSSSEDLHADCPVGFLLYKPSQKCYKLINQRGTFNEQVTSCSRLSPRAHLAAPLDEAENSFIVNLTKTSPENGTCKVIQNDGRRYSDYYIGVKRCHDSCSAEFHWQLADGLKQVMSYSDFGSGQPDCWLEEEFCVHYSFDQKWNDKICEHTSCAVCEYRLVPSRVFL